MSEPLPEIDKPAMLPVIEDEPMGDDDDDGCQCLDVPDANDAAINDAEAYQRGLAEEASQAQEPPPAPARQPTRGERLVNVAASPDMEVLLMKARGSRIIDDLSELPLAIIERNGTQTYDVDHHKIVEEAIARQIDATMWAVKALTWGR